MKARTFIHNETITEEVIAEHEIVQPNQVEIIDNTTFKTEDGQRHVAVYRLFIRRATLRDFWPK